MKKFAVRFVLTRTFEGTVEVEAESKAAARLLGAGLKIEEALLTSNDKGQLEVVSVAHVPAREVA